MTVWLSMMNGPTTVPPFLLSDCPSLQSTNFWFGL